MTPAQLTVIIPTYNRANVLDRCLHSLFSQSVSSELFDIIVADDGSPDHTRAVVAHWSGRRGPVVHYSFAPNAGANAARNRAVRLAKGAILLFINDDSLGSPQLVHEHLTMHQQLSDHHAAVLGRVTVDPQLPPNRLAALHLDRAFQAIGDRCQLDWRWFFTCNVSVHKSLLEQAGLFEERMRYHEDLELAERLSHFGLRLFYNPRALAYHHHLLTEHEFLEVARREARALAEWARKAPHLHSTLAEFGFEPALPARRRWKNRLRSALVNHATRPLWTAVARHCPPALESLALKLYLQIYQTEMRACLLRELKS